MLEHMHADTHVSLDLTDLVLGGWYEIEEDLLRDADDLVVADYHTTQRIIILTEGVSDRRMLEAAIRALYPHLADYFAFMDFDELAVPSGAGFLVGFLKAFAAAGVINRVLAVFDNDTAAAAALRALSGLSLPPNIGMVQLPRIPELERYPTLGPTGPAELDVNGLAASLELYCGPDVLARPDGALAPVQWKGFDPGMRRYHGEVVDKGRIQERFLAKALAATPPIPVDDGSWIPMRRAIDHIRQHAAALRPYEPPSPATA
jgi:hypothetical protein